MKLKKITIDRFGIWRDLEMRGLDDGLNVVYGPNEVGKTTLMQFVRSMLYGVSGDRRQRFFTATGVDAGGGSLELLTGDQTHRLAREFAFTETGHGDDHIVFTPSPDWAPDDDGGAALSQLLGDVDEPTYTAVYAIGIRELQRLACLDDADSARLLYELSTGISGSALHEICENLVSARQHLHAAGDKTSLLARLLHERDRLTSELACTTQSTLRYYELCNERDEIQSEIDGVDDQAKRLRSELRLIETCVNLREIWDERSGVEGELTSLGGVAHVTATQIESLAQSQRRIGRLRTFTDRRQHEADMARQHAEQIDVNDALVAAAGRIDALEDQRHWMTQLSGEIEQLDREVAAIEEKLGPDVGAELCDDAASSSDWSIGDAADFETTQAWKALRPIARTWQQRRVKLTEARGAAEQFRREADGEVGRIAEAMLSRDQAELSGALEQTGARVSQLRRRVQADERLAQLGQRHKDLEAETEDSLEHQLLPMWALVVLGSLFVGGAAMILAGTLGGFTEMLSFGWSHAGLGVLAVGISGGAMIWMQRAARLRLEDCQKQIGMISLQMRQADEERELLDRQLPRGGGPFTVRLQEAERELAELEELVPIDARRKAIEADAAAAEERLEWAREEVRETHDEWVAALRGYGLPAELTPKRLRGYLSKQRRQGDTRGQLGRLRRERGGKRTALAAFTDRVSGVCDEAGLDHVEDSPFRCLDRLRERLVIERRASDQRQELAARFEHAGDDCHRGERVARRLRRRIRSVLREVGAADEAAFKTIVRQSQRRSQLQQRLADIDRTLSATMGEGVSEQTVRGRLKKQDNHALEADWERVGEETQQVDNRLKLLWQSHGKVVEQLESLGRSAQVGRQRLELEVVEHQLRRHAHRWKVLSVATWLFDRVLHSYERNRQPAALGKATEYFARLTDGRYRHVWTPLDEDVLRVDDARGRTWPIEALSRGTREQLFLALRLALVDYYVEAGVHLPVVLDDVLVNFDNRRAMAAAELLRDFAAGDRQVVLLTCHDHIREMFVAMGVGVFDLPALSSAGTVVEPTRGGRRRMAEVVEEVAKDLAAEEPVAEELADDDLYEIAESPDVKRPAVMLIRQPTESDLDVKLEATAEAKLTRAPEPVAEPPELPDDDDTDGRRLRLRRYWYGGGAEEFAGEFTERVVRYVGAGEGMVVEQLYRPETTVVETIVEDEALTDTRSRRRRTSADEESEVGDRAEVEPDEAEAA